MLVCLAERAGEVVSRETLNEQDIIRRKRASGDILQGIALPA